MKNSSESSTGSRFTYIAGYLMSLALTITAFLLVHKHIESHHLNPTDDFMLVALSALALIQLFVQLVFFMHLDRESKPRWNNLALVFAAIVVFILVGGSYWIISNLHYHHTGYGVTHDGHHLTSPSQETQYIIQDEGIHP
jgi:cytochrome o ubiquinol oxidase operon protein cyoD